MIYFIDTNYFIRLLVGEGSDQFQTVYSLFEQAANGTVKLSTSLVVFFEIYWVLSSFYEQDKQSCISALNKVLAMEFVDLKERDDLLRSLTLFKTTSLDLEDCYNIVYCQKHSSWEFTTFDKKILSYIKAKNE